MSAKPKLDLDHSSERLTRLGLTYAADALPERLSQAVKQPGSPQAFLDGLLDVELASPRGAAHQDRLEALESADRPDLGLLRLRLPAGGGALAHRHARHRRLGPRRLDSAHPGGTGRG